MKLKLLSAIVVASGINTGCDNIIYTQRKIILSTVEKIIQKKGQLEEMIGKGSCELIKHQEKTTNGRVFFEGYRCDYDLYGNKIPSEYAIITSKYDKKYYGPRLEICKNIEINYGKLDKNSPLYKGNRVSIEKVGGEGEIIDDIDCKTLYNIIEG